MILTLGGNVTTRQLVTNAPLNVAGKIYKTHLIVLDGQGIDVILEMRWMRDHKALLDTASCTMQLDSLDRGIVVLQLSQVQLLHFIIPLLRSWKTFVLHVSFQMYFLMIYLACRQI
jgi:hypothetical protein